MKIVILLFVTLFTLTACSSTGLSASNKTRFYSLSSLAPSSVTNKNLRIGVGPVEISRLINRPQIVSRKDNTEINVAENHQWGGSHKEEIIQVITDNLSSLLKTESIEKYPWKFSFKPRYQVRINIERFDGELGKNITLRARWRLIQNNKEILVKRALITTSANGNNYSAYVKAQSEALKMLSQQITQQIKAGQ